jgi:hypothetical protein
VGILRFLFPFKLLLPTLLFVAGSGIYLRVQPRFHDLAWGLTETLHVAVGWLALAVYLGYQIHHLSRKWGNFANRWRLLGLSLLSCTVVALVTGVMLIQGSEAPPPWVRTAHLAVTPLLLVLLVLHPSRALTRWFRSRTTRPKGGAA